MIEEIIKLADHLDRIGEKEEASLLDHILPYIKNVAIDMGDEDHHDDNYMLDSQLTSISEKTLIIKSLIASGVTVDDWMETYIAQADLMIDNIYDKMASQKHNDKMVEIMPCGCKEKCSCDNQDS